MTRLDAYTLIEEMRASGLRITKPRLAIARALAESNDSHLTAESLRIRAEEIGGNKIDPSTVYRTIEALEASGSIHHVHLGHGPAVIHLREHETHHHLVCDSCGRTVDLPLEEMQDLLGHLESKHRFRADAVHFAFMGRCLDHPIINKV